MNFRDNTRLHILIIIVLSFAIRISAAFIIGDNFNPKVMEYEKLAGSLLDKGTFCMEYREYGEYKALLGPGYPFLTFLVYKTVGISHPVMLFVQFLLMTLFSLAIYGIAYFFFKKAGIAFIAGILSILHPGLLYYSSVNLHELNLYMPLFYTMILLSCLAYRDSKTRYFVAIGIIGGLAVLTRSTILPVMILCLAFYFLADKRTIFKRKLTNISIALGLVIIINVPWTIRNYIQFNRIIFSQTNKWEAFWIGNNPNASGGQYKADGTAVLSCKGVEMQDRINASVNDEIAIENIFKDHAFKYVKENPGSFIKGLFRKSFYFWWFYPQTGLSYPKSFLVAYKIIYVVLLGFVAAGLWLCWKRRLFCLEMIFPVILIFGIWGVHTVNFMEMRHRWTVEPVLLIFASVAIYFLLENIYQYWNTRKQTSSK